MYRFTHALFRQALYDELIAPRRIRLHQHVARALENAYRLRLDEHAAELAEHFSFSSEQTDLAKAVAYGELAAQRAMSVYAYGEAERQLQRALQVQDILDPDDATRRCDLLLQLGAAILPTDQPERAARSVAPQAFKLAEAIGDSPRAARATGLALQGLLRGGVVGVGTPEFDKWLEQLIDMLRLERLNGFTPSAGRACTPSPGVGWPRAAPSCAPPLRTRWPLVTTTPTVWQAAAQFPSFRHCATGQ
jgi:hypothetical protein